MSVKTGQAWKGRFTTHGSTGVAVDADSTPTGTLIVDGDADAASVTVTDVGTGIYKWSVTLPTLTAGQTVQMQISATVATIAATAVVCSAQADTVLESDTYGKVDTEVADIQARLPAALAADGSIKASLQSILGTAFTEGAGGRIAAAFKQFFNIASPAATMDHGILVDTLTTYTGNTPQTGDAYARLGAPSGASVSADILSLLNRLTSARAGYLDNLNVGGLVASSAEATAIQNNTRVVRVVPDVIERPDSGTTTYRIELLLYDDVGSMEAPDSAPTIALVNQSGTDLSARLDSATMTLVSTGRYRAIYTASVGDSLEQLVWAFSVVEGGATRIYGNSSLIVDTSAVDFTSSDRALLTAVKAVTDLFAFTGNDVKATLDGELVTLAATQGSYAPAKAGDAMTLTSGERTSIGTAVWASTTRTLSTYGTLVADIVAAWLADSTIATMVGRIDAAISSRLASASYTAPDNTTITTINGKLGAITGSGLNTVLGYFRALAAKASSLTPSDLSTGTTFNNTTDSTEAIRDATGGGGGGGATAADVWAYAQRTLTQTAAQVAAALDGEDLLVHRGDTFSATLTGITVPADWTKLVFTAKRGLSDADTASVVQIVLTNPGAGSDGLKYLEGAAPVSPVVAADAALTVPDLTSLTITMKPRATKELGIGSGWYYDVQADYGGDDDTTTLAAGAFAVDADVTRSTP